MLDHQVYLYSSDGDTLILLDTWWKTNTVILMLLMRKDRLLSTIVASEYLLCYKYLVCTFCSNKYGKIIECIQIEEQFGNCGLGRV